MSIAIHYTSVPAANKQVFGLQVAIHDWLRAYMRYARQEKLQFLIADKNEAADIEKIAREVGIDAGRLALLDRRFPEQNFAGLTTIFRPEPDTRNLLWQRQLGGSYAFCGLAHAISGTEAGEVLQDYILSPSEASDAIICPSQAVAGAIRAFWSNYGDYLKQRFGAAHECPVQLPVIPLGIDTEKFAARAAAGKRAEQRKKLSIADDEIVLLWVGRLSAAIKAHPLAMFQAAERAAEKSGKKIHLLMVGYFVPDEAESQFKKLAADICSKAKVTFIAADDKRFPDGLWAAGDIFLSLIDNCQESFGLTPIEAMGAGLPRVISDWDGYRDSVTDGEDGFLIRTFMPPPGNGFDLTAQVATGRELYGGFLAKTALTTIVDTEQAVDRIAQLVTDSGLRAKMADKARARLASTYDWKKIIPAYEDVWADLASRRKPVTQEWKSALPTLPDPYMMYAGFPTRALDENDVVSLAASVEQIGVLWRHEINSYANDTLVPASELPALLGWLGEAGPQPISALFAQFPQADKACLWRTIAWLLKLNILKNHLDK